jgi:hypothetical protein
MLLLRLDGDYPLMHSLVDVTAAAGAAWMMVRIGAAKKQLRVKTPVRCAACGRRRVRGSCPCTARG